MRRAALLVGLVLLAAATLLAIVGARTGMTGHMISHMATVAVAAPLIAWGMAGTWFDPAQRWGWVAPMPMMLVELAAVWAWHVPAARAWADSSLGGAMLEQAMFLAAGLLLWSAALGTREGAGTERRLAGVSALLLTSMHMTLLGALIALAPRLLYGTQGLICGGVTLSPLADQQLGGAVMLFIGAGAYLAGGLALMAGLLRAPAGEPA